MASILPKGKTQFTTLLGRPLIGGKVYFYEPNTETKKDTWQDQALTIPNTNPVILDARGEAVIWGSGTYRQVLKDVLGITIWDEVIDDFTGQLSGSGGSSQIGFIQSGDGAVARTVEEKLRDIELSPKDFAGFHGDGVSDDTVAVMACHVEANLIGARVSYRGITTFTLQANATVPVKTSTDWANAKLVILGGVNTPPSFNTFNTAYFITDDDCPLLTYTGSATDGLAKGSFTPTATIFEGHGYAKITAGLQVPGRDRASTQSYTQAFAVNRFGRVSHPLSVDLSAYASNITVNYRNTSKHRLTLAGLALTEGTWNNQRIFRIERSNVEVKRFTVLFAVEANYDNVMELISIGDSSDIVINDFVTTGRPVTTSTGSYCVAIYGGADIRINRMKAITGWGATGTDDVNGIHVNDSTINRVDCHSSGHNMFVQNCELHNLGMTYGWGGGVLKVSNTRLYGCPAIQSRQDWGGTFFGELKVDAVEVNHNGTASYTVVDLATNGLGASTQVTGPETISVTNVTRVGKASASPSEIIPVSIRVGGPHDAVDASYAVTAPSHIAVDNIVCFAGWRIGMRLDYFNLEANPSSAQITRVTMGRCLADTSANGTTQGIFGYPSVRTPTTPAKMSFRFNATENIGIQCLSTASLDMAAVGCSVNACLVDQTLASQPNIQFDACRFITMTAAAIGGKTSANAGYTVLRNCEVSNSAWDLSQVAALSGVTVRNPGTAVILPSGVTTAQAFAGWQKTGAFA
jgi:hypothetical protein